MAAMKEEREARKKEKDTHRSGGRRDYDDEDSRGGDSKDASDDASYMHRGGQSSAMPYTKIEIDESEEVLPVADMNNLDDYLELLYEGTGKSEKEKEEGLRAQIHGSKMILKLCRDVMNLEQLIQNGTVMGALTRVLQEDFKKSAELTFTILKIFLSFSNFVEMHTLMASYRIGLLTMKSVEYEIKRAELRETERTEKDAEHEAKLRDAKKNYGGDERYRSIVEKLKKSREKEVEKRMKQTRMQDKVFFVGFYILLNLAEDVSVEKKMVKKDLINNVSSVLGRNSIDLLSLCLNFLKKVSIFEENKDMLRNMNIVSKLSKFFSCSHQPLTIDALKVLFNLSFDIAIREQIVQAGLLPKLVNLLKTPQLRARTLKVLYHLSVDDRCKSMFTYTECIPQVLGMIINFPQEMLPKELAGLAVNLSLNHRNCEAMIANKGLNLLVDRLQSADQKDQLLVKIIRNVSLWTFNVQQELENPEVNYKYRGLWSPHLKTFLELAMNADTHDLLVEILGLLANMTRLDLPANLTWTKILKEHNLLHLISKLLVPGMCQNDLLLEVVLLVSAAANDIQVCELLATSNIIGLLYQLWQEKSQQETELTLQLIVCFHRFFLTEASREEAMYSTRIVSDIIECLSHKNGKVREAADSILEFVLEQDRQEDGELGRLGTQIKKKRFESFNRQYLVETMNMDQEADIYGDEGMYRSRHTERYGNDDLELDGSLDWRPTIGCRGVDDDEEDDDMDDSYGDINRWKRDQSEAKSSALYGRDYDDEK